MRKLSRQGQTFNPWNNQTAKEPNIQASSHSLKVERKEARKEEEEAKGRSIKSIWIPIHLFKNNTQHA
jgi:hypothetical protein